MISTLFWSTFESVAPQFARVCRAVRSRQRSARFDRIQGASLIAQKIAAVRGLAVQNGVFSGMRFPPALLERGIGPKLLGTYEQELDDWVVEAIADAPTRVVIIGSAEGYYAVGLGRALTQSTVLAFDIDPWARTMCQALARENRVENRLEMGSFCAQSDLHKLRGVRSLVVSDCEGFEYSLFGSGVVASLKNSAVLIETHAHLGFDDAQLIARFAATHTTRTISAAGRGHLQREKMAPYLSAEEFTLATNEFRVPTQQWIYARPNLWTTHPSR